MAISGGGLRFACFVAVGYGVVQWRCVRACGRCAFRVFDESGGFLSKQTLYDGRRAILLKGLGCRDGGKPLFARG